jgi:hypothetical protein
MELTTPQISRRDALRARILGKQLKREIVHLKDDDGTEYDIEVREPTVARMQEMGAQTAVPNSEKMIALVIDHAYIPGSDEKVFEPEDADVIRNLPYRADFSPLLEKVMELGDMISKIEAAKGNSSATQTSSSSTSLPTTSASTT